MVFSAPILAAEITLGSKDPWGNYSIYLTGPIEAGDYDRFYDLAELAPSANVHLNSPGGLVGEGLSIAAEVAIRGYSTWVNNDASCASMCSIIWMSGYHRFMVEDTVIRVHAAYEAGEFKGGYSTRVSGSANAKIGAFLNEIGTPYETISYFTSARPEDDLNPITPSHALWLGIDTHVVKRDGSVISPWERPTARRAVDQVTTLIGVAVSCAKFLDVSPADYRAHSERILSDANKRYGAEILVNLLAEYKAIMKDDMSHKGYPVWCLAAEYDLRAQGFNTGVYGPSYNCAKAETKTELAICADVDLWAMDRVMSYVYSLYRTHTNPTVSKTFLRAQRDWLVRRDMCGGSSTCLKTQYGNRLRELGA
jgi:uncharacterized protein YecT (DUF1311 family)